jgi:Tfp pilus assembly protein PilF
LNVSPEKEKSRFLEKSQEIQKKAGKSLHLAKPLLYLLGKGHQAQSVRMLEIRAQITPDSPSAWAELASAYATMGESDKAEASASRALRLLKSADDPWL